MLQRGNALAMKESVEIAARDETIGLCVEREFFRKLCRILAGSVTRRWSPESWKAEHKSDVSLQWIKRLQQNKLGGTYD
jgi:hypothetical protein